MKQLTVYGLALLLIVGTTAALAGGRDHRGYSGGHHYQQRGHHPNHYRHGYGHGYQRHHGGHYSRNYYYPSYLGAALFGSALTYSLYHTHNGVSCYSNHSTNQYQPRGSGYSEVVGCHRIERLADGSEQRIEVPMSQCQ
jgi:hypothetical protein